METDEETENGYKTHIRMKVEVNIENPLVRDSGGRTQREGNNGRTLNTNVSQITVTDVVNWDIPHKCVGQQW